MPDGTKLVYLRAGYFVPGPGLFIRETGMRFGPMSYNRWGYTYGDAVNNTDPRGRSISWGGDTL